MVLAADASASASGKALEAAAPNADNLVNIPATFDYGGDETSWCQGLPSEEVDSQVSELELSDSNSDISVGSILGVCLDGFHGDAWMSDEEEAQDDIQVGATAGVNDPGDIPWHTTGWSAGTEVVPSVKVAKTAVESGKQPSSMLSGKTVMFDLQGAALGESDDT